jgi:hypothetical protein
MRRSSPDSTSGRSPDSPDRHVHLTARNRSRDPRRHRFDGIDAAFVAACRAAVLSERTIEFYVEALDSYRAFAVADDRDLTLADLDVDTGRAWLAGFVERGRKPATVAARARALRVFSHWIVTDDYLRTDPLEKLKVLRRQARAADPCRSGARTRAQGHPRYPIRFPILIPSDGAATSCSSGASDHDQTATGRRAATNAIRSATRQL